MTLFVFFLQKITKLRSLTASRAGPGPASSNLRGVRAGEESMASATLRRLASPVDFCFFSGSPRVETSLTLIFLKKKHEIKQQKMYIFPWMN